MSEENAQVKVEFFQQAVMDREASVKAGRRIYRDEVYIKVVPKGYRDYVSRKASDQDKRDFPVAWARFDNLRKQIAGTPLDRLPGWSATVEAELRALGLNTVEQLAEGDVAGELADLQQQAQWFVAMREKAHAGKVA